MRRLGLDDVGFGALDECHHIVTLGLWDVKGAEGRMEMAQERRPVSVTDPHALVRSLHVPSGVIHRTTRARTEKTDRQLLFTLYAVLAAILPKTPQAGV